MTGQPAPAEIHKSPSKRRGLFHKGKHAAQPAELKALAHQMVDALTDDEKEEAARSSFKYLWKSVTSKEVSKELLEERDFYAAQMAMRHLASKKGNVEVALEKLQNAIAFRKEHDLDGLRLCFSADKLDLDEETKERYSLYREKLSDRMTTGRVYVCGYDKQGRSIYTIYAARTRDFEREWFLKESLYNFERALACTERETGGLEECITVIGNYTGFQSKHAAPMSISHEFMNGLRQNYPGRVKHVFLLNTPTSFRFFWSMLKPFIGTDTRKKISFVGSSEKQREQTFRELVTVDQAAPWMVKGGRKTKEFDAEEYLKGKNFDEAFD
eukprot:CAMPEP_0117009758 /NCGR_PEP_ID=MMETSP0472-20121206/8771_1 /TAXON_ID=693140 ORGANISM="Tiarina fusus, Strain LIS" /NCGR_SAMPLE_ID=MMETSP0472 /ASSEMBLY_ACC=CAM_ASM_000603 /LENGTH=326 /DNA_ID=CAMNT_0004712113 /DNA_START=110 /DNA_END=1090 /DNA_ORIENTATION=+